MLMGAFVLKYKNDKTPFRDIPLKRWIDGTMHERTVCSSTVAPMALSQPTQEGKTKMSMTIGAGLDVGLDSIYASPSLLTHHPQPSFFTPVRLSHT